MSAIRKHVGSAAEAIDLLRGQHGGRTTWPDYKRRGRRRVDGGSKARAGPPPSRHTWAATSGFLPAPCSPTGRQASGGPDVFIGEDGLGFSHLTDEFKNRMIARIHEVVAESQARADALMTEHQDALAVVATAVYQHRRLTDERL